MSKLLNDAPDSGLKIMLTAPNEFGKTGNLGAGHIHQLIVP